MTDSSTVDREAAEAMLRAMHEHQAGATAADVESFIHPEAEMWLLVSFNRRLEGRKAVLDALEQGRQAQIFRAHVERFEWLDEQTALTFARARYALEQGGHAEGRIVWLDEIRDGMIWRVRNFKQEADAREAYESGQ
jgi:ketosteroid isomerase-like protein